MKTKVPIGSLVHEGLEFLKGLWVRGKTFSPIASKINITRCRFLIIFAIPIMLLVIGNIYFSDPGSTPQAQFWKFWVVIADIVLLFSMILFFLVLSWLEKKVNQTWFLVAEYFAILFLYCIIVILTVLGQLMNPNISVLIYGTVTIGGIILIRPIVASSIYFIGYGFFYFALEWTQSNPSFLLSNRINGLIAFALGSALSTIFWMNFMKRQEQMTIIDQQKRDLEEKNQELYHFATRDQLSGLINRQQTQNVLSVIKEHDDLRKKESGICIIIADIDDFKSINDTFGHPVGDELIRHVATLLVTLSDKGDYVSRWGGDEFLITKLYSNLDLAQETASRICEGIAKTPFMVEGNKIQVTVSIGVAQMKTTFDEGYRHADQALYEAKKNGKNQIKVYPENQIVAV